MTQSSLVKVGLPSHLAEGARLARRIRQVLEQRDAAFARVEADFRERLKTLLAEEEEGGGEAAAAEPISVPA